ncbi:MAG: hypothetical protein H7273_06935 [Polaromonas sp.]|nr:hypothetical protein [Polaromonas sp.]
MATAPKAPAKKAAPEKIVAAKKAAPAKQAAATAAAPVQDGVKAKPAAKSAAVPAKKRTPNPAFMKALTLSPELSAVVGDKPLPRTEIVSKLWVYIKAHSLQDEANKRMINADKKLLAVFGKPQVSMFEMAGLIGKHVK